MVKEILKYISEEKEISAYKIASLEKGERKQYKARLLSVERDFLDYPFEKLGIASIDDMREAVGLFRADRNLFYQKYEKAEQKKSFIINDLQKTLLLEKSSFYNDIYTNIIEKEIKNINIIQNEYVKKLFGKDTASFSADGIDDILKAEGAFLSKHRARIQILLYCLARFIYKKNKEIKAKIGDEISLQEYDLLRRSLDDFFLDLDDYIFKYYNDGISEVPMIINGTMGHNSFLPAIYPLSNLCDRAEGKLLLTRLLARGDNFFTQTGRPIKKKKVERGYGVVTPLRRIGNESLNLLYLDLWSEAGVRLTDIFNKSFHAYSVDDSYYKAVSSKPIWQWSKFVDNPYLERTLLELLGASGSLCSLSSMGKKDFIDSINNKEGKPVGLDLDSSKLLVPSTRSESDHIKEARKYLDNHVIKIKHKYNEYFTR